MSKNTATNKCDGTVKSFKKFPSTFHLGFIRVESAFHLDFIVLSAFHLRFIVKQKKYKFTTFARISSVQLTLHGVNMPFKQGRTCPVCLKENLFYLRDHLRQVHNLSSAERQPLLKSATYSPTVSMRLSLIHI